MNDQMLAGYYLHTSGVRPLDVTDGKLHVKAPDLETALSGLATDAKLELVRSLLQSLDGKAATEDTVAQAKGVLDAISGKVATESTLANVVSQLQAVANQLSQTLTVDGEVQLKGSLPPSAMEMSVNSWDELPAPAETPKGATAQLIGTFDVRQNTGTEWVEVVL